MNEYLKQNEFPVALCDQSGKVLECNEAWKADVAGEYAESVCVYETLNSANLVRLEKGLYSKSVIPERSSGGKAWILLLPLEDSHLGAEDLFRFSRNFRTVALEMIGKLCGKIGHDINNLLGSIRGCNDLIAHKLEKASGSEGHPYGKHIKIIDTAVERAMALTGKIRGYARPGDLELEALDLVGALKEALQICGFGEGEAQPKAVVEQLAGAPDKILSSEFVLVQMLTSIFLNSVEAMKSQDDVTLLIYTENVEIKSSDILPAGGYVRLSVIDHGKGMREEQQERVFEPFSSNKSGGIGEGLGLSLAMAQVLVQKMGGEITVSSRPGLGTVVNLYFKRVLGED